MTNYGAVEQCKIDLDSMEIRLKALRDNCGEATKEKINAALRIMTGLWQPLNDIDNSLQENQEGGFTL